MKAGSAPFGIRIMKPLATAIARTPGSDFDGGITTADLGKPDLQKALEQHAAYCNALTGCGLAVMILEPEPGFPDCPFVEDTAVVTERCAVITLPGDPRRRGEESSVREILSRFRETVSIEAPGTVDGGDVLHIEDHFFIGLSGRTNEEGARQLGTALTGFGYTASTIAIEHLLHLKSGVNYVGDGTIVVVEELAELEEFASLQKIVVERDEAYAVNCLLVNGFLLIPAGFPATREKLRALGHHIVELEISEFRKMDGGLTCLSLRF
jgi:dimethylargininase